MILLRFTLSGALGMLVALMGMLVTACAQGTHSKQAKMHTARSSETFDATVIRNADGDTVYVDRNGQRVKIRLLGVDTPETHDPRKPVQCYGPEAANYTMRYAVGKVRVTTEPSSGDVTDKYGRTLAYIYVRSRHSDLGSALIRGGYARVYAYNNRKFGKRAYYERLERKAQASLAGRWGKCP